jgi:glycosyltransferase involved in cell wall biosynthesis
MFHRQILTKLDHSEPLNILFVLDVGFQYGAGIASLRQIQSFLLLGHTVEMVCWSSGIVERNIPVPPMTANGEWLGITELASFYPELADHKDRLGQTIIEFVIERTPDVVIVGNIHGVGLPLNILSELKKLNLLTIVFTHDTYYLTGRCAYTGSCTLFETGCDQTCPTWKDYPPLKPNLIHDSWKLRRSLFLGENALPIATNSFWMLGMVKRAFESLSFANCLHCGLDDRLFSPMDRAMARHILGIPQDAFVILSGAANLADYRKGGHIFREIVQTLKSSAYFVVFGHNSQQLPGVNATGLLRDYRKMPLIYSAADLFVGTSLEEAFGQTFCEAAACQIPSVAFRVGGVPEIAQHERNALLAEDMTARSMIQAIDVFRNHPDLRRDYGVEGRKIVTANFNLQAQAKRWINYIDTYCDLRSRSDPSLS